MVHRDLKPENVLMDMRNPSRPVPVVMDFETSKVRALSGVTTTATAVFGSAGCVRACNIPLEHYCAYTSHALRL